jgi:integrase
LNVNPADSISIKTEQRHKAKVVIPSKGEIGDFYRTLRDMPVCFRKAFFWTELLTGARPSELRGLRWDDVRLSGKNPGLQITQRADEYGNLGPLKTKAAARFLPLTGEAANVLREWRMQCPKGPDGQLDLVFPNRVGKPWLWQNLTRRQYRPLMYQAGLARCLGRDNKHAMILEAKYHPYAWRHAFASMQIEQGCNIKWLSKRMGHESVAFTLDTYGHLFEDATADQAAASAHMAMLDQLAN